VGRRIGLTILYETGDIRRFKKVGNYASYCRCVSTDRRSDERSKGKGNRKNGNPYLSWAFAEAAVFVARFQPAARKYLDRKTAKTHRIVALRALAHKLSRAVYFMLRDGTFYNPQLLFG
jgi:transposase